MQESQRVGVLGASDRRSRTPGELPWTHGNQGGDQELPQIAEGQAVAKKDGGVPPPPLQRQLLCQPRSAGASRSGAGGGRQHQQKLRRAAQLYSDSDTSEEEVEAEGPLAAMPLRAAEVRAAPHDLLRFVPLLVFQTGRTVWGKRARFQTLLLSPGALGPSPRDAWL